MIKCSLHTTTSVQPNNLQHNSDTFGIILWVIRDADDKEALCITEGFFFSLTASAMYIMLIEI